MAAMSYGRAMGWFAERDPDAVAVVFGEESVSRSALERWSNRLARAYGDRGVRSGDFVTLALPNCIEFYAASLAIWKLAATPQPVSFRLPERERSAIVELVDPSWCRVWCSVPRYVGSLGS